jgi:hypothetical protein
MKRLVLLLSLALLPGCDKSMTTEPPTETPTPAPSRTPASTATPLPIPQIAGSWSGSFDGLCLLDPYRPRVTANLRQQGAVVTGGFTADPGGPPQCSLTGDFAGQFSGNTLVGTLGAASVTGSVVQGEVHLHVARGEVHGFPELYGDLTLRR